MNLRASAGQIAFVGSPNIRCKIRDRVRNEVRKVVHSTVRYSWRVSEAFTRWSSNLGLFAKGLTVTLGGMRLIFYFFPINSSPIRPRNWTFTLLGPKFGPNSR